MSHRKSNKQVETLAWITDDEAEFWTSITPSKPKPSSSSSNRSKSEQNQILPDGQHFQYNQFQSSSSSQQTIPISNENQFTLSKNNSIEIKPIDNNLNELSINNFNSIDENKLIKQEFNDDLHSNKEQFNQSFIQRLIQELKGSTQYPFEQFHLIQLLHHLFYLPVTTTLPSNQSSSSS